MSELNWTALWVFLAAVCLFLSFAVGTSDHTKSSQSAFNIIMGSFVIFGSLAALTWGM